MHHQSVIAHKNKKIDLDLLKFNSFTNYKYRIMKNGKIKMVFLGEATVGKSSISERLHKGTFSDPGTGTIGAAFFRLQKDGISLDVWDTAGQERYLSLSKMYYYDADIIIMVFDVTNLKTIDRIKYYLDKLQECRDNNYIVYIVGNKTDLLGEQELQRVKKESIKLCKNFKFEKIFFASALLNENINLLENDFIEKSKHLSENKIDQTIILEPFYKKYLCNC